jgi:hypothetical protein
MTPKQVTNDKDTGEMRGTDGVNEWPLSDEQVVDIVTGGNGEWVDGRYVYDDED